jgi:6,7-dimethyl-8-ribityllumazine synthase
MSSNAFQLSDSNMSPEPSAKGMKVGIAVAEWNDNITKALLKGAEDTLKANGVTAEDIIVEIVPGSFELIYSCSRMAKSHTVDAVIAIGCVIRGDTPHFDYICQAVSEGISKMNVEGDVPVIFGLLTTNSQEQAEERSGGILGNKGDEYAITAIKMIDFARKYK